jgi:hypothetical protein
MVYKGKLFECRQILPYKKLCQKGNDEKDIIWFCLLIDTYWNCSVLFSFPSWRQNTWENLIKEEKGLFWDTVSETPVHGWLSHSFGACNDGEHIVEKREK